MNHTCQHCGNEIERKRYSYGYESLSQWRKRKTCSNTCSAYMRHSSQTDCGILNREQKDRARRIAAWR